MELNDGMVTVGGYRCKDPQCVKCVHSNVISNMICCGYFEKHQSRLSLYGGDLSKIPKVCAQRETRGRRRRKG